MKASSQECNKITLINYLLRELGVRFTQMSLKTVGYMMFVMQKPRKLENRAWELFKQDQKVIRLKKKNLICLLTLNSPLKPFRRRKIIQNLNFWRNLVKLEQLNAPKATLRPQNHFKKSKIWQTIRFLVV